MPPDFDGNDRCDCPNGNEDLNRGFLDNLQAVSDLSQNLHLPVSGGGIAWDLHGMLVAAFVA